MCCKWRNDTQFNIGGQDEDGQPLVVEIDESLFFRRKYHVSRRRRQNWVFGLLQRGTKQCLLFPVRNRKAITLLPIIRRHILPAPRIISDGWLAYKDIGTIDGGVFMHDVIVHAENFVHVEDGDIHTQGIEAVWSRCKNRLRRCGGTSAALFPSYMAECMWREHLVVGDVFSHFLVLIATYYVV